MSRLARVTPQLGTLNVEETQRYYRDVLGFKIDWTWGENDYGSVSRDDVTIFLSRADGGVSRGCLFVFAGQVDELYSEWREKGADIVSELEDKPWGMREFTIRDNNGHQLRLAQSSRVSGHVARDPAEGLKIVRRLPSLEEYKTLIDAVQWTRFNNLDAARESLPQSLFAVVAEIDGQVCGMARVIGDGQQFFYIMDVAVTPEMQGRGVGTALMNEIVDYIQAAAPENALVGLYTGAALDGFYARFGFHGPDTGLYGMTTKKLRKA